MLVSIKLFVESSFISTVSKSRANKEKSRATVVLDYGEVASLPFIDRSLSKRTNTKARRNKNKNNKNNKRWDNKKKRPFLTVDNYNFRNSVLGLKLEFAGRFSRAQRKYFSAHQKGRVPFNSFVIPMRTFCLPVILKFGVSTVKIWVAYSPPFRLLNYSFNQLKRNYVKYPVFISYFASNTYFLQPALHNYMKNRKFKISNLLAKK